jgi:catechol 2,3-dioxygenase-like lactoylglutathione lyase family enzyme
MSSPKPIDTRGFAPLLEVFDIVASVHFYRDILGLELVSTSGPDYEFGWCMLRDGEYELMLNAAYENAGERPPAPDPARVAAHKEVALYFGCPDPDAAYRHLLAHGLAVQPPVNAHYGMRQVYVLDPDGYNVCFQWPV